MKGETTILQDWQKFMVASLIVGAISVLWNLLVVSDISFMVIWVNFLEKVFAFNVLGVIFSFFSPKFLKLESWRGFVFAVLVAVLIVALEAMTGVLTGSQILSSLYVRGLGSILGVVATNMIYRRYF